MTKAVARRRTADIVLPRYDEMCTAIAACHKVDDAKDIRDKAEALRAYAKKANNREAEVQFADIKLQAERKCGELLKQMAADGQRKSQGESLQRERLSLKELGVSEIESHRFQQIAAVPKKDFDAALASARATQTPVTSASVRSLTRIPSITPAQRAAHERLWRVLRALEQIAEQDISPKEWLAELPDFMLRRVRDHMKRARPWLEKLFTEWEKKQ